MKNIMYLGILITATTPLFLLPIFNTPDLTIATIYIITAIICFSLTRYTNQTIEISKKYILLTIPLLISIVLIPFPYNLGLLLLFIRLLI